MGGCSSTMQGFRSVTSWTSSKIKHAEQACDKTSHGLINAVNDIVSVSIMRSINSQVATVSESENISVSCHPQLGENIGVLPWPEPSSSKVDARADAHQNSSHPPTEPSVYEENIGCALCLNSVFDGFEDHHRLERRMWTSSPPARVRTPLVQEVNLLFDRVQACGLKACKACVLSNVTQYNSLASFTVPVVNETFQNTLKSNIQMEVEEQLKQNTDVLSAAARVLGISGSKNDVVENISNKINSVMEDFDWNTLRNNLSNIQSFQFVGDDGGGDVVHGVSMDGALNVVVHQVTKEDIANQALSEATLKAVESIINSQTTLNNVGDLLFGSVVKFSTVIDTTIGRIMLATIIGLGLILLFIFGYMVYNATEGVFKSDVRVPPVSSLVPDASKSAALRGRQPNANMSAMSGSAGYETKTTVSQPYAAPQPQQTIVQESQSAAEFG